MKSTTPSEMHDALSSELIVETPYHIGDVVEITRPTILEQRRAIVGPGLAAADLAELDAPVEFHALSRSLGSTAAVVVGMQMHYFYQRGQWRCYWIYITLIQGSISLVHESEIKSSSTVVN